LVMKTPVISLRKRLEAIEKGQSRILGHLKKMEDEDEEKKKAEEEEEEKKKADEKEEEENKKKAEEELPAAPVIPIDPIDEEDKSKQDATVGTTGDGEDVKIPKAAAGETGENSAVEGDKGPSIVEKAVENQLKKMGFVKTTTPRAPHNAPQGSDLKKSADDNVFELCE